MFPWNHLFNQQKSMGGLWGQVDPNQIDQYVKDVVSKAVPESFSHLFNQDDFFQKTLAGIPNWDGMKAGPADKANKTELKAEVFETHDHVFVRFPLEDRAVLKQIKAFHTPNQFIIDHYPDPNEKHILTLPSIVQKKGTKAVYHNGVLEFKLIKNHDIPLTEIDVQNM